MVDMLSDSFLTRQRLLVIAPDPADAIAGCAGSMARIKSSAGEVYVVVASVADAMRDRQPGVGVQRNQGPITSGMRLTEFASLMKLLKVDGWDVLFSEEETDPGLDQVPGRDIVHLLTSAGRLSIGELRPTMMMIPTISYRQGHEALFRACVTATQAGLPGVQHNIPFMLAYENTALIRTAEQGRFHPNVSIDISDFLQVKLDALRRHDPCAREPMRPGSPESLELVNRLRGHQVSVEAAEAFVLLRACL